MRVVRILIGATLVGYYDGVIFHRYVLSYSLCVYSLFSDGVSRIVPGFLVQTGDKTGTGGGGESFYGGACISYAPFLGVLIIMGRVLMNGVSSHWKYQNRLRMKFTHDCDLRTAASWLWRTVEPRTRMIRSFSSR